MRTLACPLIVALSVFVSCFLNRRSVTGQTSVVRAPTAGVVRGYRGNGKQRALKQSPGTVNLWPRVPASQPGVPTVKVTVDRKRVPLGDEVTFTFTPASVVLDPRYIVTVFFGDGTSQRVRQTEIVYLYRATGTYTYSILVKSAETPPAQNIPRVTLSAYPTPVATESPVAFTAQLSNSYPNIRYRFIFGDGNESQWQDGLQTTHAYKPAGKYLAYVDIGAISGSGVKPLGGSVRQPIDVISPSRRPIAVTLSVNPRSVEVKQPATLLARVDSREPNITYRFSFGDRSGSTVWQVSPRTTHVYSVRGTYPARVDVQVINSQSGSQTASSNPLSIEVKPAFQTPSPGPTISPIVASPTPTASPPASGSPSPTLGMTSSTGGGGTSSTSPTPSPSGTPTSAPTPNGGGLSDNWWKYLLLALILLVGYQGWKYFYAPRPTLVPKVDPGVSQLGSEGGPLAINFQMELNPNVTDGQVMVNTDGGSLIKSERKSDA